MPELVLVDVRNPGEVAQGTIDGARAISLPELLAHLGQLDQIAPTVVFCAGGYRSAIASSLLRAHGFADVSDLDRRLRSLGAAPHDCARVRRP